MCETQIKASSNKNALRFCFKSGSIIPACDLELHLCHWFGFTWFLSRSNGWRNEPQVQLSTNVRHGMVAIAGEHSRHPCGRKWHRCVKQKILNKLWKALLAVPLQHQTAGAWTKIQTCDLSNVLGLDNQSICLRDIHIQNIQLNARESNPVPHECNARVTATTSWCLVQQ